LAWPTTKLSNVYSGTSRPIFGVRTNRAGDATTSAARGAGAAPFAATTTRTSGSVAFVARKVCRIQGKKCRVTHS